MAGIGQLAELTPFADGVSKTLCRAPAKFGGMNHERPFGVGCGGASAVDGVTGALVPPSRPEVLVERLRTLIADSAYARRVRRCRRRARQYPLFVERIAARTMEVYQEVCSERARHD